MSTLENNILTDKLVEAFNQAIENDHEMNDQLAKLVMDDLEYYRYEKGEKDLLEISIPDFYEEIENTFYNCEGSTFNIRLLVNKTFNLNLDDGEMKGINP